MGDTTKFKQWLGQIVKVAALSGYREVVVMGQFIADDIRNHAPQGKTGKLKQSVRWELDRDRLAIKIMAGGKLTEVEYKGGPRYERPVRIGSKDTKGIKRVASGGFGRVYDYSLGVEFGTTKLPARPYFWPTWRADRAPARRRINEAMKRAIEAVK